MHGDLQVCSFCPSDSFANCSIFDSESDFTLAFPKLMRNVCHVYVSPTRQGEITLKSKLDIKFCMFEYFLMTHAFLQKVVRWRSFLVVCNKKWVSILFSISTSFFGCFSLGFVWNDHHCKSCNNTNEYTEHSNAKHCGVYVNIIWKRALIEPATCVEWNQLRWKAQTHIPIHRKLKLE